MQPELDPVARLNRHYDGVSAQTVLEHAVAGKFGAKFAMVSSFGAESVVLLHMIAQISQDVPVLFVDTEMLFPETIQYQQQIAQELGLTNIIRIRPDAYSRAWEDPLDDLHVRDVESCCNLRKVRPLADALRHYDVTATGRKRHQSATRAVLQQFETEAGRIKINPLYQWSRHDQAEYIKTHDLPPHPLVAQGYPSIGCGPCTSKVAPGEDPRAGRWRGSAKEECGIHFIGGRLVRGRAA